MRRGTALVLLAFVLLASLSADIRFLRDPYRDVEKRLGGPLEEDQRSLVTITVTFYAIKYGRTKSEGQVEDLALPSSDFDRAVRAMSKEEYDHAVEKAALIAESRMARTFLKLGKYGEKALKALIVVAEDVAKDLDRFIKEKAIEFDTRHS